MEEAMNLPKKASSGLLLRNCVAAILLIIASTAIFAGLGLMTASSGVLSSALGGAVLGVGAVCAYLGVRLGFRE